MTSTIEEARARLGRHIAFKRDGLVTVPGFEHPETARPEDIGTLLTALATAEAERDAERAKVAEAVGLMEPAITAGTTHSMTGNRKALAGWAVDLASFVDRQKVDGGARG